MLATCLSCQLMERRLAGNAPPWDDIYRGEYWCVVHSYNSALLGWLVLIPYRHIEAIDELSEVEAIELGKLLQRTSLALKQTTGCLKTYVMQFAEHKEHPHVHFHVVARMSDQPEERKGAKIFGYATPTPEEQVRETQMNELAFRIRALLQG